jgi:hypothetical protein
VKITWGDKSKEFPAEQLAAGINLAAEFFDNPFYDQFVKVHQAVSVQQAYETPMIKALVDGRQRYHDLPGAAESDMMRLVDTSAQDDANLRTTAAKLVLPVTHTIKIEVK